MQRKKPGDSVKPLRYRKLRAETKDLHARLARWALAHVEALRDAEPEIPRN